MEKLENVLGPIAEKLNNNKVLVSIRDGFLVATPLIIAASVFLLIQNFPVPGYAEFMSGIFGENWSVYLGSVSNATFSLIALLNVVGIGYSYARQLDSDGAIGSIIAFVSYFIITPQTHPEYTNEAGEAFNGFSFADLGSEGLFLGMVTAIIAVRVAVWVEQKGWVIKLPEGVPPMVMQSFSSLIPAFFAISFFFLTRIAFSFTSYEYANEFIYAQLQTPLMGLGRSAFFPVIYQVSSSLFWFFGINGPAVTNTVFGPISTALTYENLAVYQEAGVTADLPNIYTSSFSNFFGNYGGGGSTLSLVIMMVLFAKSQRLKQLSRLSLLPGVFGINEMVIYGVPIVLNPVMIIPFMLVPMMNISLAYGATYFGIIPRTFGLSIPWTTPIFFSGWLATGSLRASFFQLFLLGLGCLIYYPFLKVLDKQYLEEEDIDPEELEEDELDGISLGDISFD